MALEIWEIKALENDLLDYSTWVNCAVEQNIYNNKEYALKSKALKCAKRMLSTHGFNNINNIEETIIYIVSDENYKNREEREVEVEEDY